MIFLEQSKTISQVFGTVKMVMANRSNIMNKFTKNLWFMELYVHGLGLAMSDVSEQNQDTGITLLFINPKK